MRSHHQVNQSLKSLKSDLLKLFTAHFDDLHIVNNTEQTYCIMTNGIILFLQVTSYMQRKMSKKKEK